MLLLVTYKDAVGDSSCSCSCCCPCLCRVCRLDLCVSAFMRNERHDKTMNNIAEQRNPVLKALHSNWGTVTTAAQGPGGRIWKSFRVLDHRLGGLPLACSVLPSSPTHTPCIPPSAPTSCLLTSPPIFSFPVLSLLLLPCVTPPSLSLSLCLSLFLLLFLKLSRVDDT